MLSSFQEAFPRYPFSIGSLRRTVWFIFTRHGVYVKIVMWAILLCGVSYGLFRDTITDFMGNKELAQGGVWVTVFFVSVMCCYYLTRLVYNFQMKILFKQFQYCGTVLMLQLMVALFSLGVLSTYSLLYQVRSIIQNGNMSSVRKIMLNSAVFVAVLQRFLSAVLICIALPVTKRWVGKMKPTIKLAVLQLLPWKVFYFLHHNLLFPFTEKPVSSLEFYKDSFYILDVGFHIFHLVWLLFLALYIGYELSLPCKHETRLRGKKEMAGIPRSFLHYPQKSQVVTGLSPGHYALRYKGFQSDGEDKELKARLRNNSMAHEQYRIVFSQLD